MVKRGWAWVSNDECSISAHVYGSIGQCIEFSIVVDDPEANIWLRPSAVFCFAIGLISVCVRAWVWNLRLIVKNRIVDRQEDSATGLSDTAETPDGMKSGGGDARYQAMRELIDDYLLLGVAEEHAYSRKGIAKQPWG
jgi:hypothetical protein